LCACCRLKRVPNGYLEGFFVNAWRYWLGCEIRLRKSMKNILGTEIDSEQTLKVNQQL